MSGARARRSFTISLPASDPASGVILAWLERQPVGVDASPAMRQALAQGLTLDAQLQAIHTVIAGLAGKLDACALGVPTVMPVVDDQTAAVMSQLLDFGHLE